MKVAISKTRLFIIYIEGGHLYLWFVLEMRVILFKCGTIQDFIISFYQCDDFKHFHYLCRGDTFIFQNICLYYYLVKLEFCSFSILMSCAIITYLILFSGKFFKVNTIGWNRWKSFFLCTYVNKGAIFDFYSNHQWGQHLMVVL